MKNKDLVWAFGLILLLAFLLLNSVMNDAEARQYNVSSYFKTVYVGKKECLQTYRYFDGQEIPIGGPICEFNHY